jgi:hypothetical protein
MDDQALIAGLSSGKMLMWGKKGLDQNVKKNTSSTNKSSSSLKGKNTKQRSLR